MRPNVLTSIPAWNLLYLGSQKLVVILSVSSEGHRYDVVSDNRKLKNNINKIFIKLLMALKYFKHRIIYIYK